MCDECGDDLIVQEDGFELCPTCDGGDCDDHDGQPSEYDEWQDFMGGDDWDFGQCDEY